LRSTFPTLLGGLYMKEELEASVSTVIPAAMAAPVADSTVSKIEDAGKTKMVSPQTELESLVIGGGYDFNLVQKFVTDSGNITDAGSLSSFAEIPTDEAKRLLKNKVG